MQELIPQQNLSDKRLQQAQNDFNARIEKHKTALNREGVSISEIREEGQLTQWQIKFKLANGKNEEFFIRFGEPKSKEGELGIKINQHPMKVNEEGFSLRDVPSLKDINKAHIPLAVELSLALSSGVLNDVITTTIHSVVENKPMVGSMVDARRDLADRLAKIPHSEFDNLTLPLPETAVRKVLAKQNTMLPYEKVLTESSENKAKAEDLAKSMQTEFENQVDTDESHRAFREKYFIAHAQAVELGYWLSETPLSERLNVSPIVGSFQFSPSQSLQTKGAFKIFDAKTFPEAQNPITMLLLDDPTIPFGGQTVGANVMINKASCKTPLLFNKVAHDEASHIMANRVGLITKDNRADKVPGAVGLSQRIPFQDLSQLGELVSCAASMDISPTEEIERLLSFRYSQITGEYSSEMSYSPAIDLFVATLKKQKGAEDHMEVINGLQNGLKDIARFQGMDQTIRRFEVQGDITKDPEKFMAWVGTIERSLANDYLAEARSAMIDLSKALKTTAP